jgi:hypothetical protein
MQPLDDELATHVALSISAIAHDLQASAEEEVRVATGAEGGIDGIDTLFGADQPDGDTCSGHTMLTEARRAQVALVNASASRGEADRLLRSAVAFMPTEVYIGQLAELHSYM